MAVYKVFSFMLVIVLVTLQAKGISDVEAIEAQARIYETALAAGDIDRVERLYAEDCRIFNNDALPVRGRAGNYSSRELAKYICMHLHGAKGNYACSYTYTQRYL